MAFPQSPLGVTIEIQVDGVWQDITADVYLRNSIQITWGKKDWASKADTTKCPLTINNGRSNVNMAIIGRYSPRNPASDLFGLLGRNTPLRISVTTPAGTTSVRFTGFVSSWPVHWDVDEKDIWVSVQANGIRRRLAAGTKAVPDALRRHVETNGPILYWPLTDGEDAREGSEVIAGSQPIRSKGVSGSFYQGQPNWSKGTLAPWMQPVIELPDNTQGLLTAYIPPRTLDSWSFDYVISIPGTSNSVTLKLSDTGQQTDANPLTEWQILVLGITNLVQVIATDKDDSGSSTTVLASDTTTNTVFDGGVHHLRLTVSDDGSGDADWTLHVDGDLLLSGSRTTPYKPLGRLTLQWLTDLSTGTETVAVGHLAYWGESPPDAADTWRSVQGYSRELAGRRIERLCAEQGVLLAVNGDLDLTPPMGPQKQGAFLDLLQAAADVDGGVLYESRGAAGLEYRTRMSKYNQT